ncbi:MAG: DUF1906 domain-containing protein [Solirubrobacterales bacterium]|nr:DUF1906 domain-containing protein [Solirubrobacterales bacterium]
MITLVPLLALFVPASTSAASRPSAWKTVSFRGYSVSVPRVWPVYRLGLGSRICVRFDRPGLYLGTPSAAESCPAHAAGRSEAILLEPAGASAARAGTAPATLASGGSATSFLAAGGAVRVLATWSSRRELIAHALHRQRLPAPHRSASQLHPALDPRATPPGAHTAQAVYTGQGFDACTAPSEQTMAAWGTSPYRAIGIYIGGVNSACAQPNLNSSWVGAESAAGWHMIPTYVGLQAPSNSCGCAGISASQASAEGTAAAQDAVSDAQTLGLGPDTPIYDDMENYSRTQSNSPAVLAYLSAWTAQLHAEGYLSGVYGNSNSVMADLVAQEGTNYPEPDDIWIANWNDQQTTSDSVVPSSDWASHQRLHQYRGGHNETYGGATINIDSDYLDGATAQGGASTAQAPPPPTLSVAPAASGITTLSAAWGGPGLVSWRVLAGTSATNMTSVGSASSAGPKTSIAVRSSAPYFAVQAVGSSGQWLANSSTLTTPAHLLLFGHSVFVSTANGMAGVPAGCYLPTTCHLSTTVSLGRLTLARTGTEAIPAAATGLLFFRLTGSGLRTLERAGSGRLAVQVTLKDVGGHSSSAPLTLIPFTTSGPGQSHSNLASPLISALGATDFVYARGAGGILTACSAVYACRISATLSVGRLTIASTGPELVSGRELGYVVFSLSAAGRKLLLEAPGNQLAASLVLRFGSSVARARITLAQFA